MSKLWCKSISNGPCKAIFGPPTTIVHVPVASLNTQILQKKFWSCYRNSLNLENTVAAPNHYFLLKNIRLNKKIFFLFPSLFLVHLSLSQMVTQSKHKHNNRSRTGKNTNLIRTKNLKSKQKQQIKSMKAYLSSIVATKWIRTR